MTVRGPEGDNSFVISEPNPGSPVRAYVAELAKAIALLMGLGGFAALALFTYHKWGWAILVFWR